MKMLYNIQNMEKKDGKIEINIEGVDITNKKVVHIHSFKGLKIFDTYTNMEYTGNIEELFYIDEVNHKRDNIGDVNINNLYIRMRNHKNNMVMIVDYNTFKKEFNKIEMKKRKPIYDDAIIFVIPEKNGNSKMYLIFDRRIKRDYILSYMRRGLSLHINNLNSFLKLLWEMENNAEGDEIKTLIKEIRNEANKISMSPIMRALIRDNL